MEFESLAKLVNIPFAVIEVNGKPVVSSPLFDSLFPFSDAVFALLSAYEVETAERGFVVEKTCFVGEEKKTFSVFIQKIGNLIFVVGIDVSYSVDLINALVRQGEELGSLLNALPVGVYFKKIEGDFVYKNSGFLDVEKFLDYPDKELMDGILKRGKLAGFRKLKGNDGEFFAFECAKVVDYGEGRGVIGVVLVDRDNLGLDDFLKREAMLERIAYYARKGVLFFEGRDLTLTFKNRAACEMLPPSYLELLEREGLFGDNVLFDASTISYIRNTVYSYGECELLNYKIPHVEGEFDFEFVAGSNDMAVFFKRVVPKTEKDAFRQFRSMYEFAADAIFLMKDFIFVECNKKALELFGCSKTNIVGKTPLDFSPDFQQDGMPSEEAAFRMIDYASKMGNQVFEWVHKKCDGSLFSSEVTLSRFQIGGYTYTMAIVRDISTRKSLIDSGRCFLDILSDTNPVFVFDKEFKILLENSVKCEINTGEVKKYAISLLTRQTEICPGVYEGKILKYGRVLKVEIKILSLGAEKYFVVKLINE